MIAEEVQDTYTDLWDVFDEEDTEHRARVLCQDATGIWDDRWYRTAVRYFVIVDVDPVFGFYSGIATDESDDDARKYQAMDQIPAPLWWSFP